jgi:prepilin-type N-terminal cleavage/methylation domain-containing protein
MRRRRAGLTLIELMIVVAIVGILAIIGTVGYRRLVNGSRSAEPKQMVGALRLAQESYKAETGNYAAVHSGNSKPTLANFCPANAGQTASLGKKFNWNPACGTGTTFAPLPVHTDGPVRYGYASIAGGPGLNPNPPNVTVGPNTVSFPPPNPEWYLVYSEGDTDGNGSFTSVVGSSFTRDIWVEEE